MKTFLKEGVFNLEISPHEPHTPGVNKRKLPGKVELLSAFIEQMYFSNRLFYFGLLRCRAIILRVVPFFHVVDLLCLSCIIALLGKRVPRTQCQNSCGSSGKTCQGFCLQGDDNIAIHLLSGEYAAGVPVLFFEIMDLLQTLAGEVAHLFFAYLAVAPPFGCIHGIPVLVADELHFYFIGGTHADACVLQT